MINLLNIRNIIQLKNNNIIFIIFIFIFFISYAHASVMEHFTLKNGLDVHLIKNNNPTVTQIITYKVGSINEPSGKEGMAHLLEHVMFLGTNKYSKELLSLKLKSLGATYNAYTSNDITLYNTTVPLYSLEEIIKIEADRMKWLSLNPHAIENEKKVINEERNMGENNPYNVFFRYITPHLFPTTNYGRSVIGTERSLKSVTKQDLVDFYRKWYNPSNATLFISGNIDFKSTKRLIQKYYGKIHNSNYDYGSVAHIEENYKANVFIDFIDNRINQNIVMASYLVPSLISDNSNNKLNAYSLIVLQKILSSKTGDMYKHFVLNTKIATDINIDYDYSTSGTTSFNIMIIPSDNQDINMVKQELISYLKQMSNSNISDQTVSYYIKKIKDDMSYLQSNQEDYVFYMARLINAGMSWQDFENYEKKITDIRSLYLNRVMKNILSQPYVLSTAKKGV